MHNPTLAADHSVGMLAAIVSACNNYDADIR